METVSVQRDLVNENRANGTIFSNKIEQKSAICFNIAKRSNNTENENQIEEDKVAEIYVTRWQVLEIHDHVTVTRRLRRRSQTSWSAKRLSMLQLSQKRIAVSVVLLTAILFFDSCIILSTSLSRAVDCINFPQHAPLG